jgi:hypothetical protein
MSSQHLRELLAELQTELARTNAVDDRSRDLLRDVDADIRAALDRTGEHPESLGDRLRETVERFEGTHPQLSEAVGRVLDALVKMGI